MTLTAPREGQANALWVSYVWIPFHNCLQCTLLDRAKGLTGTWQAGQHRGSLKDCPKTGLLRLWGREGAASCMVPKGDVGYNVIAWSIPVRGAKCTGVRGVPHQREVAPLPAVRRVAPERVQRCMHKHVQVILRAKGNRIGPKEAKQGKGTALIEAAPRLTCMVYTIGQQCSLTRMSGTRHHQAELRCRVLFKGSTAHTAREV